MSDDLVYSTNPKANSGKKESEKPKKKSSSDLKMRLEKRHGKEVTLLFELPFSKDEAKQCLKELQGLLSTGGTYKDEVIEIRGDFREKISAYFAKKSIKVIRAGG